MGLVKEQWMELMNLGISSVPDKKVCHRHFADSGIKSFIRKESVTGFCDYCRKDLKAVELEELMKFIIGCINRFFEDAVNFMSYDSREGGYLGTTYSAEELIYDLIELDAEPFELLEDIVKSIDDVPWAKPPDETERDYLYNLWQIFQNSVKHESRYLYGSVEKNKFENPYDILNEVGRLIVSSKLIRRVPKGTKIYRYRQHDSQKQIDKLEDMVSPPTLNAIYSNRFSPSGISMFYSAFDSETAYLETIKNDDRKRKYFTVAELEFSEDFWVIDFSKLPRIPSIFEIKNMRKYYLTVFLHDLVKDFTKEVSKDGMEHIEYVPTQIVTEFLRFKFNRRRKNKIEGIVYPSSKNRSKTSSVFFWDHEQSSNNLTLTSINRNKLKK